MNILIVSAYKKYTSSRVFISPLIFWEKDLRKDNIYISIKDNFKHITFQDIIIVDSKFIKLLNNDVKKFKEQIYNLKKKCNKIILSESTDSCSWLLGDLIDYFDFVWKGQLYKNKSKYKEKHYGGRLFTNKIYESNKIKDSHMIYNNPLNNSQINKLKISWNSGLIKYIDYRFLWRYKIYHNKIFRGKFKNNNYSYFKTREISSRFNLNYERNTIKFIRENTKNYIKKYTDTNKINLTKYFQELFKSKICISPFGWGEICYRDFECFESKCLLLKNNMSHLETWPNYFVENSSYIPFELDSSDLIEKIEEIINDFQSYKQVALNGYKNFNTFTHHDYGSKFSSRLKELINIYENN